ncbi:MAG: DMT family transporter [Azovibrio sp.]|uniref:DMT family transporter n=1 Tax=Azovibrio sp. TaxID=1872673 RepID=UPI003C723F30
MKPEWPRWCSNPYLLLTLSALFWSGNMVLGRGLRDDIPPIALAFWRWLIAFALVLPLALPHWSAHAHLIRRHLPALLLLAALGIASYNTLAYLALQTTTATNALLLNAFVPIATLTLAWIFFKKRLSRMEGIGVAVSLLGALTLITRGDPASLATLTLNTGDLWMLGAVLVWACYTLGLQFRPPGMPPMLLLAVLFALGLIMLAPFYLWEILQGRHIQLHTGSLLGLAYLGIFPSFIGYIFYNRGVAEVGASRASLFIHLMPVFGILLAALFLNERPSLYHLLGMSLIFTGIALVTRKPVRP